MSTYDPTQASGIEESIQEQGGNRKSFLFADGVRQRFFNKEGTTTLLIMPSFGRDYETNPSSWCNYRNPNDQYKCTCWVRPVKYWSFVAGVANILSPKTFDPNAIDVVQAIWDIIKSNPEWRHLAGLDPATGKKPKDRKADAYKDDKMRPLSTDYAVNAVNPHRVEEQESDISCIYLIMKSAFSGSGKPEEKGWGLLSDLNREQIEIPPGTEPNNFDARFLFGDITDPTKGFRPCVFGKKTPPTGGTKMWNGWVQEKTPRTPFNPKFLETRYRLFDSSTFCQLSQAEILDIVTGLFLSLGSNYEKLLRQAYSSRFPGYSDKLIKLIGVTSDSTVHQAGFQEQAPVQAPAAQPSKPAQGFAPPPPMAAPAPSMPTPAPAPTTPVPAPMLDPEYWATLGGQTVSLKKSEIQKLVDRGENPPVILKTNTTGSWVTAKESGFVQDAIPGVPASQPTPPAPAAFVPAPAPVQQAPTPMPPAPSSGGMNQSDIETQALNIMNDLLGSSAEVAPTHVAPPASPL